MNKAHQASGTSGCTDSPMIPGSGFPPGFIHIDVPRLRTISTRPCASRSTTAETRMITTSPYREHSPCGEAP